MLKIIDAFNKKFIFFYNSNGDGDDVTFSLFLLGRKCDADRYLIDFEVRKDPRKIKFLEICHSDSEVMCDAPGTDQAFTISKKTIETLVEKEEINFRFIIKRKDVVAIEDLAKEEYLKKHILVNETKKQSELATTGVKHVMPYAMKAISSVWNEKMTQANAIPSTSNAKVTAKKLADLPSTEVQRKYEQNIESVSRPQKMDASALVDVVQSFNLSRTSNTTDGNQHQMQQQFASNPVKNSTSLHFVFNPLNFSKIFIYIFSLISGSEAN